MTWVFSSGVTVGVYNSCTPPIWALCFVLGGLFLFFFFFFLLVFWFSGVSCCVGVVVLGLALFVLWSGVSLHFRTPLSCPLSTTKTQLRRVSRCQVFLCPFRSSRLTTPFTRTSSLLPLQIVRHSSILCRHNLWE